MQIRTVVRLGAVAFVAIAITASVMEARMSPEPVRHDLTVMSSIGGVDPLRAELERCQSLGATGATDHDCLRAWAENRRRFLAPDARPEATLPAAIDASSNAANGTDPSMPAMNALGAPQGEGR